MKLYLLEVYPETIAVLNHIVGMLERDGVSFEIVVNVRLKGVMLNWITGWTLNQRQYRTCPTIEEMVGQVMADLRTHEPLIPIAMKAPEDLPFPVLEVEKCGKVIETGYPIRPTQVILNKEMIEKEVRQFSALLGQKKHFNHSTRVAQGRKHTPKVVMFCSAGFAITGASLGDGSGMGNLLYILARNTAQACRRYGYDMVLTTEDQLEKLELGAQDKVIGLTVNGAYGGGCTTLGQGFQIRNLRTLASRLTGVQSDPIMVCCLHATEFGHYGALSADELRHISRLDFQPFHAIGIQSIQAKGLKSTGAFPIPIDKKDIKTPSRVAASKKTVMLQLDIQTRKNGEYSLCMLLDAATRAITKQRNLEIEIICKASAAHSYQHEGMLKDLLAGMNYQPNPKIKITFQGAVSIEEWDKTRQAVDLLVAFSLEEGLHYFVPEMWMRGAFVVLPENGALSAFEELEGIVKVPTIMVPSFGSGIYNDYFEGQVPFPEYNGTVARLSDFFIQAHEIKPRELPAPFDTDGELIAQALKMTPQYRKEIKILRSSHAYARISL